MGSFLMYVSRSCRCSRFEHTALKLMGKHAAAAAKDAAAYMIYWSEEDLSFSCPALAARRLLLLSCK